jgi:chemotaxis signal transduction protein
MGLIADHHLPEPMLDATLEALADRQVFALLALIGSRRVALPALLIERVFPVAAWVPIASGAVVGALDVRGEVLPVIDARVALGKPMQGLHPDQYLALVAGQTRFLLWLDGLEDTTMLTLEPVTMQPVAGLLGLARFGPDLLPVLDVLAFATNESLTSEFTSVLDTP